MLIADDQYLFAESLQTVLSLRSKDFTVANVVANGREALEWIRANQADVVLMDVRMPEMDGVEATRRIIEEFPEQKIVMLTTFRDDQYVHQALNYGAVGYVLKNTPLEDLMDIIRTAKHGVVQISPDLVAGLVSRKTAPVDENHRPEWITFLSSREKEVLQLMAEGLDNRHIAEKLYIAPQTVKNHVSQIYEKIGTRDRMEAVRLVRDLGKDLRVL